jgi:hypothetical protein
MTLDTETHNAETPYLVAALVCERLIVEKDGVVSLIRLVDNMNTTVVIAVDSDPIKAASTLTVPLQFALFLSLRAGPARGKREVLVNFYEPSGDLRFQLGPYAMVFTSKAQGHNVNVNIGINLAMKDSGIYWFEVVMGEIVLTRLPFTVNVAIQTPEQNAQEPETPKTGE